MKWLALHIQESVSSANVTYILARADSVNKSLAGFNTPKYTA